MQVKKSKKRYFQQLIELISHFWFIRFFIFGKHSGESSRSGGSVCVWPFIDLNRTLGFLEKEKWHRTSGSSSRNRFTMYNLAARARSRNRKSTTQRKYDWISFPINQKEISFTVTCPMWTWTLVVDYSMMLERARVIVAWQPQSRGFQAFHGWFTEAAMNQTMHHNCKQTHSGYVVFWSH